MTRVIVVTSGKGGVGKTNLSVNIGAELACRGQRTCLFDADLGMANVNILLGVSPGKTIDDFVFGNATIPDIIATTPWALDVIPGSSGIERMANLAPDELRRLVHGLASLSSYDFLLIDTSSGISRSVISFCLAAPEVVLVLTGEMTSLTDAYGLLKVLSHNSFQGRIRLLINKCASLTQARHIYIHFKTVTDKHLNLDISPLGAVLDHDSVEDAVIRQKPYVRLYPDEAASQCLQAVVDNLLETGAREGSDWTVAAYWDSFFRIFTAGGKGREAEQVADDTDRPDTGSRRCEEDTPQQDRMQGKHQPEEAPGVQPVRSSLLQAKRHKGVETSQAPTTTALSPVDLTRLPPSPVILRAAVELLAGDVKDIAQVAEVIGADSILTARLVELYRLSTGESCRRGAGVRELAESLGLEVVKHFLEVTVIQAADGELSPEETAFTCNLGRHGFGCALLCREIARHVGYPCPEEAYFAGLFHWLGYFVASGADGCGGLLAVYPASYASKVEMARMVAEHCAQSVAQAGAAMVAALGGSPMLVGAICYQDESCARITTAFDLTKILYVALRLCYAVDGERAESARVGAELFRLNANHLLAIVQGVEQDVLSFGKRYGLENTSYYQKGDVASLGSDLARDIRRFMMLRFIFRYPRGDGGPTNPIRTLFQNLNLLFGVRRVFCLLPDDSAGLLRAQGYPGCFGENFLEEVTFRCDSEKSHVARTYRSGAMSILDAARLRSLGDKQLVSKLQTAKVVFLPILHKGKEATGLLVFGLDDDATSRNSEMDACLQQFSSFAASMLAEM